MTGVDEYGNDQNIISPKTAQICQNVKKKFQIMPKVAKMGKIFRKW